MPADTTNLHNRNLLLTSLVVVLLLGLPLAVWLDLRNISDSALRRQATDMDLLLTSIRSYYGKNVVSRVMENPGGTRIVHNYHEVPGAIPIPATLSIELARTIGEQQTNISYRFVSDHPFANRSPHVLDEFETNALAMLRKKPDMLVMESSWTALTDRVRLISPVKMGAACVTCHNSHPASTKTDWRLGDVRGIQEVSIMQPIATNIWSFKYLLTYFLFMSAVGFTFIALQRRQAAAVVAANRELAGANTRMQKELSAAAQVQEAMLPTVLPNSSRASFAWLFRPCAHVAGDTLNVFQLDDDHVGMYVLDVVGHGPAAAMLAVAVARVLTPGPNSFLIRPDGHGGQRLLPPSEVATRLNERFPADDATEQFFTLLYGVLDLRTYEFRCVSAGHPWPIHVPRAGGPPRLITTEGGPPIGIGDEPYGESAVQLQAGDTVYLYSDGIPDAMNPKHELFGMERFMESLAGTRGRPLTRTVSALWTAIETWTDGAPLEDDATLVALQIEGE
jgi:serine phosphatase RsbU (regulator of sigma subunit)